MTAAYGGICCARPPCINVCLRKATYSHGNIMEKKAYTVNIASEKYVTEVDYFGMASGRDVAKFEKTGLTPTRSELVDVFELGMHTMFVGEVMDVKSDEDVLHEKTHMPAMESIKPLVFDIGTRSYLGVGDSLGRAYNIGKSLMES